MNRKLQYICLAAIILLPAAPAFSQEDIVTKAMRDEMARSMKKLQLENLEKPYFISYTVADLNSAAASASFGSLNGKLEPYKGRFASIQLRVGDYKFDNRNFFAVSFGSGVSRGTVALPLDDNYDEIRRQLWLATDSMYKKSLEDISKKRALLANKNRSEVIADFSQETPSNLFDVLPAVEIKLPEMESLVRDLSALFKQAPGVSTSSVNLLISNQYLRYINSEGTTSRIRQPEIQLSVSTSSQAADGQPISAGFSYRGRSMSDLPTKADIAEKIKLRSKQVAELRTAALPDRYAGPILFEGEAAAEVVWRSFMPHIIATPEVLVENPQYRSLVARDSENLIEKIGLRVLPEFLSMTDDPTAQTSGKTRLLGTYKVDSEGVPTRRMEIVENGLLMKLLTGRSPVLGISQSSGSYHNGGVGPSNVIISSTKSLTLDQLRTELLRRAKIRGKDYAIIVRKVDFTTRGSDTSGLAPGSMAVLLAYKRFADGHEEPIRNAIINGISFGSFKDILAVSDTPEVWSASFAPKAANPMEPSGTTFVSVATPALLFEDATVQKPAGNVNKPPFVEHPYFAK